MHHVPMRRHLIRRAFALACFKTWLTLTGGERTRPEFWTIVWTSTSSRSSCLSKCCFPVVRGTQNYEVFLSWGMKFCLTKLIQLRIPSLNFDKTELKPIVFGRPGPKRWESKEEEPPHQTEIRCILKVSRNTENWSCSRRFHLHCGKNDWSSDYRLR